MATLDELSNALRNADAAGDVDAARMLASEIQKVRGAEQDPYQARAQKEFDELKAKGVPVEMGKARRYAQGMSFNAADEVLAGLSTPFEMIKRGTFNPVEGYKSAKAAEDVALEDSRKNGGIGGTLAEIGGGVMSGAGLGGAGLTAARFLPQAPGLMARTGASLADGAVMGGVGGFMDGNGLGDRAEKGLQGGAVGGLLGGIVPPAIALGGTALAPITSNIRARINPEGFARTQVARGVVESGQTPAQLAQTVGQANAEGQGMFTLADAMGNSGQRMLATTARSPGQARTDVVNFLDNRQAGQGRRVTGALAEGFDSPQTAQQTQAAMTAARKNAADTAYDAVRTDAQPVDVSGVISKIDDTLKPYGVGQNVTSNDASASALAALRARLTDGKQTANDFNLLQRVRGDLSDEIQAAVQSGAGNKARLLGGALRELDTALEQSSSGFRTANRNFAQASRDIEAVDLGRSAAMRGRTEDIIPQFQAQSAAGQRGYRAGYVDPLIQQTQGAAFGANKARPLINDAFADEAAAMAPGNPLMQRRIGREDTMFQTRQAAAGNSKTAENMNDDAAMGIDPSIIGHVLSGNVGGALKSVMSAVSNGWNGNTAGVREEVARILMQRGQNVNPQAIQRLLDETVRRIETMAQIARQLGRGASGGVAVAPGATGQRR